MSERYAVIKDKACVNIVVAQSSFAARMGWVMLPEDYGMGDSYSDNTWSHPETETAQDAEQKI